MATWSFTPQDVVLMALGDATRARATAPACAITGTVTSAFPLGWELSYPTVGSADAHAMHLFYRDHQGGRVPFTLVDPLVSSPVTTYDVRFAGPFRIAWAHEGALWSVGPLRMVSSHLSDEVLPSGIGWGGEGEEGWGGEGTEGWGGR